MGEDKIRYLLFVSGRWRWRPTKAMRARGFALVSFGRALTAADKARALALNSEWDNVRLGLTDAPQKVYAPGSIGEGYQRCLKLRGAERAAKGIVWTKEQEKRDDWPRAWRWLEPAVGDEFPLGVAPENLLKLRSLATERVSPTEGHRVIKVWRAMWKKLQAFGYVGAEQKDPSLAFANTTPEPRQDIWHHAEVLMLVECALTRQRPLPGLAALMATIWDSMLSPGDARTLTPGQRARDGHGALFFLDRAKTGRAAAGTLTPWSERLLDDYLAGLGVELLDNAPIFRTAGSEPGPRGGRRWLPQPYTTRKMDRDFRTICREVFGPKEQRQLADMRRSGTVEADAGATTDQDLSNKMANTIAASARLRKVYAPVNVASVRRVDVARERGRAALAEQNPTQSVMKPSGKVS